jgi:hypothetical protein
MRRNEKEAEEHSMFPVDMLFPAAHKYAAPSHLLLSPTSKDNADDGIA